MNRHVRQIAWTLILLSWAAGAGSTLEAQTACRTANCAPSLAPPAECQGLATVRVLEVSMQGALPNFVFSPSQPKVEPSSCVRWVSNSVTHSGTQSPCPDTNNTCANPVPASCMFETGNVSSAAADNAVTCFYDPADFPAATIDDFYCRIHASPTTGSMRGTLRVTTAIDLAVDTNGTDIVMSWTGGGVAGSETFEVHRAADAGFTAPALFPPDGGATGRSFTDAGENDVARPTRYYLITNQN